jgi:leucyl aminopeptidase
VVALGSTYAGLMSNDDAWADHVLAAARRTGELVWRMPLHHDYAEMIKGRYGQIVNSTSKREATALTAGEFLHHFAGDVPWAHLDIAGTAYDVRRPYFADKGATGYGVRDRLRRTPPVLRRQGRHRVRGAAACGCGARWRSAAVRAGARWR